MNSVRNVIGILLCILLIPTVQSGGSSVSNQSWSFGSCSTDAGDECSCTLDDGLENEESYCCLGIQRQDDYNINPDTNPIPVIVDESDDCDSLTFDFNNPSDMNWSLDYHCREGLYDVVSWSGSQTSFTYPGSGGTSDYCNDEDGSCRVNNYKEVFYDESQWFCEECDSSELKEGGGSASGVWADDVYGGMDIYNGDFIYLSGLGEYHGTSGTCCGDDTNVNKDHDNADWAQAFCYRCHVGDNQGNTDTMDGVSPRMWLHTGDNYGGDKDYIGSWTADLKYNCTTVIDQNLSLTVEHYDPTTGVWINETIWTDGGETTDGVTLTEDSDWEEIGLYITNEGSFEFCIAFGWSTPAPPRDAGEPANQVCSMDGVTSDKLDFVDDGTTHDASLYFLHHGSYSIGMKHDNPYSDWKYTWNGGDNYKNFSVAAPSGTQKLYLYVEEVTDIACAGEWSLYDGDMEDYEIALGGSSGDYGSEFADVYPLSDPWEIEFGADHDVDSYVDGYTLDADNNFTIDFSASAATMSSSQATYFNHHNSTRYWCCGDDYSTTSTNNDCGRVHVDKALCWLSNDIYTDDYDEIVYGYGGGHFPETDVLDMGFSTANPDELQWYWTTPSDAEYKMINISCGGNNLANKMISTDYDDKSINILSDGDEWLICDPYSFTFSSDYSSWSAIDSDNVKHFNKDSDNPIQDVDMGYATASFMCQHAGFDTDGEIDLLTQSSVLSPTIVQCQDLSGSDDPVGSVEDHFFGGSTIDQYDMIPYFGAYENEHKGQPAEELSWGKISLQEFFRPDITSLGSYAKVFPSFSNVTAAAYIPPNDFRIEGINLCRDSQDESCLVLATGDNITVVNSDGEMHATEVSDISGSSASITGLTFIPQDSFVESPDRDSLFGSDASNYFFYDEDGDITSGTFGDLIPECDDGGSLPDASEVKYIAYYEAGYMENIFPRLVIHTTTGTLYEFEYIKNATNESCIATSTSSSSLEDNWNQDQLKGEDMDPSDFDSYELIWNAKGLPRFFLPKYTPGLFITKGNAAYIVPGAPLICDDDAFVRDLDDVEPEIQNLCNNTFGILTAPDDSGTGGWSIGGKFHGEYCCGDPQDPFETYFGSDGLCYMGAWFNAYSGASGYSEDLDSSHAFFRDNYLNTYIDSSDYANEMKELILNEGAGAGSDAYFDACAVTNDDAASCNCDESIVPGCCAMIDSMAVNPTDGKAATKPYQGNTTLLYNWRFNNEHEPWKVTGSNIVTPYAATQKLKVKIKDDPVIIKHQVHKVLLDETHNFRIQYEIKNGGIGENMTLFAWYIDTDTGAITVIHNETFTIHHTEVWKEAVLVFDMPSAPTDFEQYRFYVGVAFDGTADHYHFFMKAPKLSSNDYLTEITVNTNGDGHGVTSTPTDLMLDGSGKDYCSLKNINNDDDWDYFCSFREVWEKVPDAWENTSEIGDDGDIMLKFIPETDWFDQRGSVLVDESVQVAGCCHRTECWNGTGCVDSMHEDGRPPKLYPNASSRVGYRCMLNFSKSEPESEWIWSEPKWDWENNDEQYGYCQHENQCLVDYRGNFSVNALPQNYSHYEKYTYTGSRNQNPICINDSQYILDHYCNDGNWTTRTYYLVEQMLSKVDGYWGDYTLFCDEFTNALNLKDSSFPYYTDQLPHFNINPDNGGGSACSESSLVHTGNQKERFIVNAYLNNSFSGISIEQCLPDCYYRDSEYDSAVISDRRYPCTGMMCVLTWEESGAYKAMVGAVLNQELTATNFPFMNLIGSEQPDFCTSGGTDSYGFISCPDTTYYSSKYHPDKQLVVFTNKDQGYPTSTGTWFTGKVQSIFDSTRAIFWNYTHEAVIGTHSHELNYTTDFSKVYLVRVQGNLFGDIFGIITTGSPRNHLSTYHFDSAEHISSRQVKTDSYLNYSMEYDNDTLWCDSLSQMSSFDGYTICDSYNEGDTVDVVSRSGSFYDSFWPYLTARLRPGR